MVCKTVEYFIIEESSRMLEASKKLRLYPEREAAYLERKKFVLDFDSKCLVEKDS